MGHLGKVIDNLESPPAEFEDMIRPVAAAQMGFDYLASKGQHVELTAPLASALQEIATALVEGDSARLNAGVLAAQEVCGRILPPG